uniref:Uncharacterized protein n=1 Tax=Anguilla anguilla TaxID=7936 RepID=A0A0E9VIM7_ANGAN
MPRTMTLSECSLSAASQVFSWPAPAHSKK